MHTLFKFKKFFIGVTLVGLVLLPALGVFVAQAQTAPRGSDAPAGRVLQAATCNENDAVTVQVSPATPKIGGTVKFTGTVKSECQAKVGGTGNGGSMWLYHGEYTPSNTQFEAEIANGFTISKEFPITPQLFSPGQHLVGVKMSYCAATFGEPVCLDFLGRVTISVEAAATTGGATLTGTVEQQVQFSTIREVFTLVYGQGGSGKAAAKIQYECGNDNTKRTANVGDKINCDYEKKAGTYTFTATALDASGNPIQGATFSKQITLTGNETNATGVDSPGLGDLAFGGFELFIGWLLKLFGSALKYTILWIVGPFIESILSIHTYDDKFANVIYPAWEIFRNLGNIFFILSIVAIGVATVFRISGWAVKDLLVKLIVGAILINFSLSIAQSILGIADTVQNQFLPNDTGAIRQIVNHLFTADLFSGTPGNLGGFGGVLEQIMNFFLTFGSFIAFLGIAALLTVRILFLWILLMLSPLPYIAMVLPISRSMSKKWWSEFGKWAFITPVMAFMLNLTALITVQTKASNIIQSLSNTDPSKTDGVVSGVMFAFASNAIPLGFLYMTLKAATAFGSGASGFINKAAEKGVRAAFWPAAAAGAAIGAGAAKVGAGAAAVGVGAKNIGMLPFTGLRNRMAVNSQDRQDAINRGTASTGQKIWQGAVNATRLGEYAKAKRERLQGNIKDLAKKREEQIKETEQRVLSWDGARVGMEKLALRWNGTSTAKVKAEMDQAVEYQKIIPQEIEDKLVQEKKDKEAERKRLNNLSDEDYAKASKASIESAIEGLKEQINEKTQLQQQEVEKANAAFNDQLKDVAADKSAASDRVKDLDAKIAAKQSDLGAVEAAQSTRLKDIDTQIAAKRQQIEAAQAAEKDPNNKSVVLPGPEVMSQWQSELSALEKEKEKAAADKTPVLAVQNDISKLETEKAEAVANQAKLEKEEEDIKLAQTDEIKKIKQSYGEEISGLDNGTVGLSKALETWDGKEPIDVSHVDINKLDPETQAKLKNAFGAARVAEMVALDNQIGVKRMKKKTDENGNVVIVDGKEVEEEDKDKDGNTVWLSGLEATLAGNKKQKEKAGLSVGTKVTDADLKNKQAEFEKLEDLHARSSLKESFLATKNRVDATKAASARAPFEAYDYESRLRAFKEAEIRGDKYLALNLIQEIQKEGDFPDMLRRSGYSQTLADYRRFMEDKLGKLGFSEKELLDIAKESDDRMSSSAPGLAGAVKINEKTRTREWAKPEQTTAKLFDKAMAKGDGTLGAMWSKMGAPNVLSWNAKANEGQGGYEASAFLLEGLDRLDPEDEIAMRDFYRRLSAAGARQLTTDLGWLKDQEGAVDAIKKQIQDKVRAKMGNTAEADKKAELVYQMIQAKSGQYRQASAVVNKYLSPNKNKNNNSSPRGTAGIPLDEEDDDLTA